MGDISSGFRGIFDIQGKVWGSLSLNEGEEVHFHCQKSFGLHLVQNGPVTLRHDGVEQILNSGDFVLVPNGTIPSPIPSMIGVLRMEVGLVPDALLGGNPIVSGIA